MASGLLSPTVRSSAPKHEITEFTLSTWTGEPLKGHNTIFKENNKIAQQHFTRNLPQQYKTVCEEDMEATAS